MKFSIITTLKQLCVAVFVAIGLAMIFTPVRAETVPPDAWSLYQTLQEYVGRSDKEFDELAQTAMDLSKQVNTANTEIATLQAQLAILKAKVASGEAAYVNEHTKGCIAKLQETQTYQKASQFGIKVADYVQKIF